jgi:hypothetical protein
MSYITLVTVKLSEFFSPDESLKLLRLVAPDERFVNEHEDGEGIDGNIRRGLAPKFPPTKHKHMYDK